MLFFIPKFAPKRHSKYLLNSFDRCKEYYQDIVFSCQFQKTVRALEEKILYKQGTGKGD